MRIHLNLPEHEAVNTLNDARRAAGVIFERASRHGSRSHAQAFDVILSGDAPHRLNSGQYGGGTEQAASWDQWGIFLAVIFDADPSAKCWAYANAEDFHRQTGFRFADDEPGAITSRTSPGYQSTSHKWDHDGAKLVCANKRHGECGAVIVR